MNPLGVLRAEDAMEPLEGDFFDRTVTTGQLLSEILELVARAKTPVGVLHGDRLVGQLTSEGVLSFLSGHVREVG